MWGFPAGVIVTDRLMTYMTPSEKPAEIASTMRRNVESSAAEWGLRSYFEVQRDADFLFAEYDRLVESYPDLWIAIYEGKVVAAARKHTGLLKLLESDGFDKRSAIIEFMSSTPQILVF